MGKGKKGKKKGGKRGGHQGGSSKQQERQERQRLRKEERRRQYEDPKWRDDFRRFQRQLKALELGIFEVEGDGNCAFRAVSHQMEGSVQSHIAYRLSAVQHMRENAEEFAPFLVDLTLEEHCDEMSRPRTWATHLELTALSHCLRVDIVVHQLEQPRWVIECPERGRPQIHLSYHNGDHYSSVVRLDGLPHQREARKAPPAAYYERKPDAGVSDECALVMAATGCCDAALVQQVLAEELYDVEMAIAVVMQRKEEDEPYFEEEEEEEEVIPQVIEHEPKRKGKPRPPTKRVAREALRIIELEKKKSLSNKERKELVKLRKQVSDEELEDARRGGKPLEPQPLEVDDDEHLDEIIEDLGSLSI